MLACVQSRNVVMVLKQVNSLRDRSARSFLRATVWLGPPGTAYGNVRFWRKADDREWLLLTHSGAPLAMDGWTKGGKGYTVKASMYRLRAPNCLIGSLRDDE